jgi:CDI immunity protein
LNYTQWIEKLRTMYDLRKRALFQDLEHCGITAAGGTITIKPLRYVKLEAWEGFAPEIARELLVSADSSPQDIGATLRRAFDVCSNQ